MLVKPMNHRWQRGGNRQFLMVTLERFGMRGAVQEQAAPLTANEKTKQKAILLLLLHLLCVVL